MRLNEDTLVQQTTTDYLCDQLGWESIYAYNDETFGPEGTLGRKDDREVVLTRYLGEALVTLNPCLPQEAYQDAIRQITAYALSQSPLQINQEKHDLLKDGVQVSFRDDKGELVKRRLMKEGFETPDGKRIEVDEAFKNADHPFRIVIVCAMWLTGFDVPSLSTLYLDKPLKAHTLMQAIARANRVYESKNNGLIVEYCGILKNLRRALATFAGHQGGGTRDGKAPQPEVDPVKPEEELLADLVEAIAFVRGFLTERGFRLDDIIEQTGFARNKAIANAKESANENDESRKRFEILAREVIKKFKACISLQGVNAHRRQYDAINIIYASLQADRDNADIAEIIRRLHAIVDETIEPRTDDPQESALYDMSQIDFDRLRKEFERSPTKNTTVQNLKEVIERRLARMIQQNPLRMDFQRRYEEIIAEYNRERDRATIEKTFEELLKFVSDLDKESTRVLREGLDEETQALFDLLKKPELPKKDLERLKQIAAELLTKLKAEKLRADNWREKEATRDAIKVEIRDFLWSEDTGLPESYSEQEIEERVEKTYLHLFNTPFSAELRVHG